MDKSNNTAANCTFCGHPSERDLYGHYVCRRCYVVYWQIGERVVAGDELHCACGRLAAEIIDANPLCAVCAPTVQRAVESALAGLPWARTLVQISDLPEASS